ncbi:hypothetical protein EVAR_52106_1 [Eumeta japonica]|uniref:Reverse transcriptase domain-containing protein n=1 Tax=Eumeta variegata TaxID=151549 RepID=A0A4C1XQS7_EUMVA|nr:hypothetical protein EVAR_52106_1 [Eumeta japonica]
MAGCRGLGSVKVEPLDYEDDADKEKSIRVKTENECYCSLTINVKEVPIEYEISIKDELDVGPTVLQPTYSSGSPVDTIEEKQSPVSSSAMLYWKRRAMTSAERTRKYRKRKREAAGSNIAKSASTISESEENPHRDLQPYILQLTDIKFRTKPKTSAERMREYRKRKREATSLNFINIASTNDCVLDLKENQGLPHDDHKPYIMVELRTEPKSSTERGREYRKRKKKGAAVYETERSCTKNMWSEVTANDAAVRKDERFLHVPDGTRKDSLLTSLSTGLTSSSELIIEYECGLRTDELFVKCLLYANDRVIFAPTACALQEVLTKMNDYVKKRNRKVKINKTKAIAF